MNTISSSIVVALLGLGLLSPLAMAQQTAPQLPTNISIDGVDDIRDSLQRIELRLAQFAQLRWEYQFVQRNRLQSSEKILAELGAQGWELVNVTVEEGFILKRSILPR